MRRFLRIFRNYALVAAAVFLLQWFPIPVLGAFVMLAFGIFWIGAIVHLFMLDVTVQVFLGRLPRSILIIPATFYAAGLAVGLSSDIPAWRWQSGQQWFEIDKQIPADTHGLTFSDRDDAIAVTLGNGFLFEKLGFKLFERGSEPPSSYYLMIGGGSCAGARVLQFSATTIRPTCQPISLYIDRNDVATVGTLTGAHIRKRSYFLFPTAGCGLVDNPASWQCDWLVSPLWRDAYVGYYTSVNGTSGKAFSILMAALAELRANPAPAPQ
jgi:hypothetical protein